MKMMEIFGNPRFRENAIYLVDVALGKAVQWGWRLKKSSTDRLCITAGQADD